MENLKKMKARSEMKNQLPSPFGKSRTFPCDWGVLLLLIYRGARR